MDSLQHELSDLFHRAQVRKTRGIPPRISVIDLAMSLTGKSFRGASRNVGVVKERYPEFSESLTEHKFPGQRQRVTPVCEAKGAVELILLLPGKQAAQIRKQAAALLVRHLGGARAGWTEHATHPNPTHGEGGAEMISR